MATRVVSGIGSLAQLPTELDRLGAQRVAVVVDQGVAAAGVLDRVLHGLDPRRLAATLLIDPDPDVAMAERAALGARDAGCDVVLAVGGGSALGAAKAVAIRLTNTRGIATLEGVDEAPRSPAPSIAIPTTAGSGGEVSRVLVLHEPGRDTELVVRVDGAEPRIAILDATVLRGLPPAPMLYAGLDALSHGLEAQWARRGSWLSSSLGKAAAAAIIDALPGAVTGTTDGANGRGDNDAVLQRLLEASSAANMACGNSGLALVHALTGSPAVRLPHGQQNGTLLPHVARFNASISDPETLALVARLGPLYQQLGFPAAFPPGSVSADGEQAMLTASRGHAFRANNRKDSTDEQLIDLLRAAGTGVPS